MYPIERYIKVLKVFVRQKARPEGSIVEGYLIQERICMFNDKFEEFEAKSDQAWNEEPEDCKEGTLSDMI